MLGDFAAEFQLPTLFQNREREICNKSLNLPKSVKCDNITL